MTATAKHGGPSGPSRRTVPGPTPGTAIGGAAAPLTTAMRGYQQTS